MTSEASLYRYCKYWSVPDVIVRGPRALKQFPDDRHIIEERGYDKDHILYEQIKFRKKYPAVRCYDKLVKQYIPLEPPKTTGFSDSDDMYDDEAVERALFIWGTEIIEVLRAAGVLK